MNLKFLKSRFGKGKFSQIYKKFLNGDTHPCALLALSFGLSALLGFRL